MCNQFKLPKLQEIKKYLQDDLSLPLIEPKFEINEKDIFPSSTAPVLLFSNNQLQLVPKNWGYPSPVDPKKTIFNARIERFYEKRPSMWDQSFARQRCIIISKEFFESSKVTYEFNHKLYHERYSFHDPENPLTLIAGIYDHDNFSMVTTKPNSDMTPIHNRMPLIIKPTELRQWLFQNFTSLIDRNNFKLAVKKLPSKNNLA